MHNVEAPLPEEPQHFVRFDQRPGDVVRPRRRPGEPQQRDPRPLVMGHPLLEGAAHRNFAHGEEDGDLPNEVENVEMGTVRSASCRGVTIPVA